MERSVYQRLDEIEGEHWWFRARRDILRSVIARYAPSRPSLRILEAGCGTGGNLAMLAEFGRLEAFEYDEEARRTAEKKAGMEVRSGSLPGQVPFPANHFDIIAAFDVIEHIKDDEASLAALKQHLAPGGRLVMTVPALPWLWSQHDVTHHHFRRYTKAQLKTVLAKAGLRGVLVTYYNTLLFPPIALLRLIGKAAGGREGGDDVMPSRAINHILKRVFGAEKHLVGRVPLPIGISLLAVAEKVE